MEWNLKLGCMALAAIMAALLTACGPAAKDNALFLLLGLGNGTTITRVYGQGGIFTVRIFNNGGISANSLYSPRGAAVYAGTAKNRRVGFVER